MEYLENLNPAQREAVEYTDGPLLILAGAGAGKTKVITTRILHLTRQGIAPEKILAITFTNKAASEMRERVVDLIDKDPSLTIDSRSARPFVSTFHSLGVHILKQHAGYFGLTRHFSIFDRSDSKRIIKRALEKLGIDPKQHDPGKILSVISRKKGEGLTPGTYEEQAKGNIFNELVLQVWREYEKALQEEKALDFDDLLLKTLLLLKKEPKILEHYQNKWSYIHIDEFQDTNGVQYEISRLLAEKHKNICVVGDMDQNIYSWRGANMKHIFDFEEDFPNAHSVLLEENYRSTKTIITVANATIAKNTIRKEKNLFTNNMEGENITLYTSFDEQDEARFIAEKASELIRGGTPPEEIAILYRANFQSRAVEQAMIDMEVPHQVLGTKFFDRKEIKDTLTFLRLALNPDNTTDLSRIINVPPRGIGKTTLMRILANKESELTPAMQKRVADFRTLLKEIRTHALSDTPSETLKFIIRETGMEKAFKDGGDEGREDLENVRELVTLAQRYDELPPEEGIESLLESASLTTDQDSLAEEKQGVKLLTVHASKGLEFDVVFITGLEEGLFPHQRLDEESLSKEAEEEERRLFYVALTRARRKLFLTHALVRTVFGSRNGTVPSEFITGIDEDFLDAEGSGEGGEPIKTVYLDF
ncbi:MAG: UvrD-helicase domain-containing protein [Candidatus Campbellbacteria bacterium]|nr:UvrD-helicase domain-containing protein [Candidatus Campbellbacteria bacterium]